VIPGFNHNIKHKGRVFHVQTEDSGPKNPHIITHLFVGGNILASKKTKYDDLVGQAGYEKTVRSMMEEQHKQMLRNLINGAFDSVSTGEVHHLNGPAPVNVDPSKVSPSTAMMAGAAAFTGLPSQSGSQPAAPGPQPVDIPKAPGGIQVVTSPPSQPPTPAQPAAAAAGNIFGDDLISEKSLDEVILSYLSEDVVDE
jgi:hypothetical protein